MRVFITGGTGYIGSAAAQALLKAGHQVAALARSPESAASLKKAGVEPLGGSLADAETLTRASAEADAVVHAAIQWGPEAARLDELAVRALLAGLEGRNRPFLYTSGVWVIGDTVGRVAGEMAALRPPAIVAWRPAVEKLVLAGTARNVHAAVVRPAIVYGRGGGILGQWVRQARQTRLVRVVGDGENHWSFVHVEALADLYVRVLEQAPRGELFLAADGPAFPVREIAEQIAASHQARVEFWPLEEARREIGPLADALVMDQRIMSTKAGRMLGWAPRWPSVLEEIRSGCYAATR